MTKLKSKRQLKFFGTHSFQKKKSLRFAEHSSQYHSSLSFSSVQSESATTSSANRWAPHEAELRIHEVGGGPLGSCSSGIQVIRNAYGRGNPSCTRGLLEARVPAPVHTSGLAVFPNSPFSFPNSSGHLIWSYGVSFGSRRH